MKNASFVEIKKTILDLIAKNKLKSGDRLPSLRKLSEQTGSSLLTVHRVIASLCAEGILYSKVGSGTYFSSLHKEVGVLPSRLVAIIVPELSSQENSSFISDMIKGIEDVLKETELRPLLTLKRGSDPDAGELNVLKSLSCLNLNGIIANLSSVSKAPVWNYLAACRTFPLGCAT